MLPGEVRRGVVAGAAAGLVAVAGMYVAADLAGVRPLPRRLQEPLLAIMPGPVFGFLIDRLQHLGKVLEEIGLISAMVILLALAGGVYGAVRRRRSWPHLALLVGLGVWLLVSLTLEPASGGGFFGLEDGIVAPVVLLTLLALYGLLLELSFNRLQRLPAEADPGRRRMLVLLPAGVAAVGLAVLGLRLGPGWYRAAFQPAEAGLNGQSPELTPRDNFYVVSKDFSDPVIAERDWRLSVNGLVERPQRLSYQDLRALPAVTQYVTLECISNNVGGPQMSTAAFTGVSLSELVASGSPKASARHVYFKARDGYTESLPLNVVMDSPEILVAYLLDGAALATPHGFPARMLIPGRYGMKGPKWLDEIQLPADDQGGYWETQGWDHQAVVKTTARIDSPSDGDLVRAGQVLVSGVAFAGNRGISAVEVSTDGGGTWSPAELRAPLGPLTWTLWSYAWPASSGSHLLRARARDGRGDPQTSQTAPSFPSGASGYHTIRVDVTH